VCAVVDSTVCDAVRACLGESAAPRSDPYTSSFVFVVRGYIADAGVQPDAVVFGPFEVEFGFELAGVGDLLWTGT
jgi:hypothetical protein